MIGGSDEVEETMLSVGRVYTYDGVAAVFSRCRRVKTTPSLDGLISSFRNLLISCESGSALRNVRYA